MMTFTDHDRAELARAAQAFYAVGANAAAHRLSAASALGTVSVEKFDDVMATYRAWLVFGTIPTSRPAVLDALQLCNSCGVNASIPSSLGGYCAECEADARGPGAIEAGS